MAKSPFKDSYSMSLYLWEDGVLLSSPLRTTLLKVARIPDVVDPLSIKNGPNFY